MRRRDGRERDRRRILIRQHDLPAMMAMSMHADILRCRFPVGSVAIVLAVDGSRCRSLREAEFRLARSGIERPSKQKCQKEQQRGQWPESYERQADQHFRAGP